MLFSYETIGLRIKDIRKKANLSQESLAELTDLSTTYISLIENGVKCMSLETLVKIANALKVTADTILSDCFTNHIRVSQSECNQLLDDCSTYESRIIIDTAKALKQSLRSNHFILPNIYK